MKPFGYITAPANRSRPKGLILAFCGWGGKPEGARKRWGLNRVADQANCAIVYPRPRWRNWGGPLARQPRFADCKRLSVLLADLVERYHHPKYIHLLGLSDGGSFALTAAAQLSWLWPIASVTSYSGFYQGVHCQEDERNAATYRKYPILLLRNDGETLVREVHQDEIRAAYEDHGHIVTQLTSPRRREWWKHRWRRVVNHDVLQHIVEAMSEPISTGEKS